MEACLVSDFENASFLKTEEIGDAIIILISFSSLTFLQNLSSPRGQRACTYGLDTENAFKSSLLKESGAKGKGQPESTTRRCPSPVSPDCPRRQKKKRNLS